MLFQKQNTPRWLIFIIDMFICACAILLAYLLRFNFEIPEKYLETLPKLAAFMLLVKGIGFLISKVYAGIIRYTGTQDVIRIFIVNSFISLVYILTNITSFKFSGQLLYIPYSIIIIDFIASTLAMTTFRILVKITYLELTTTSGLKNKVIIFGAGETGLMAKRALDRDLGIKYKIIAFIDENPVKQRKKLEGSDIYGFDKLEELITQQQIDQVIIAVPKLKQDKKNRIVEACLKNNTKVLSVPPVSRWINGELSFHQLKKVRIDELLGREEIIIDDVNISKDISKKIVMITGAAGSIGGELVRQVSKYKPTKILLLDQAETPLYNLELELLEVFQSIHYEIILCDITNSVRMEKIFTKHSPDIIFHAAAYKHVPMMENNPAEAVFTNVGGTKIIADLAAKHRVEKFIMISTDKAVNPTSVMGASKRLAEIYTQSLNQTSPTRFITTRFGNVLGSNGSVIPLFTKQIENGGPVTITHPDVTRYFMTIPEACQLVLEAFTIGKGGEIFLFDMGKSIKIIDLAKKMIQLSGLELGKDIQIVFSGLRPGEKLYEELLNDQENTIETPHPQILIAKVREYDYNEIKHHIEEIISINSMSNRFEVIKKIKKIIPEYVSKNSLFEQLDTIDD